MKAFAFGSIYKARKFCESAALEMRLRDLSRTSGLLAFGVGCLGLIGWVVDAPLLKSFAPGLVAMKANTAFGILSASLSFLLVAKEGQTFGRRLALLLAGFVFVIGSVTLLQDLSGRDFGIDQLLFRDLSHEYDAVRPGRMAPSTACCFMLLGGMLVTICLGIHSRLSAPILMALSGTVGLVAILTLTEYIFGAAGSSGPIQTGLALNTAIAFLFLSFGLIARVRREHGWLWAMGRVDTLGFISGVLLLVLTASAVFSQTKRMMEAEGWVNHTRLVLYELQTLNATLLAQECGERAFLISGNPGIRLVQPESLSANLRSASELISDNASQLAALRRLEMLLERWSASHEKLEQDLKIGGPLLVRESFKESGAESMLKDCISVLRGMMDEEKLLLVQREAFSKQLSTTLFMLLPLGVLLSIATFSVAALVANFGMGEKAKAENAEFATKRRLASIIESSADAIVAKDLNSTITDWNPGAEVLFGYAAQEMVGKSISQIIPPERAFEEQDIIGRIRKGEQVPTFETVRVGKNGKEIMVSVTISPIRDAEGRIVGASKVARDITDRIKAEQALRASEERIQAVMENLVEGLVICSADEELLYWNRSGIAMHGFSDFDDLKGRLARFKDIFELSTLDGEALACDQWPMQRILRGETVREAELNISRKDIAWRRIFSYSGALVNGSKGEKLAFLTIFDITEKNASEEKLRRSEASMAAGQKIARFGTWELDLTDLKSLDSNLLRWSDECYRIFGIEQGGGGVTNEIFFDRVHPDEREVIRQAVQKAMEGEGDYGVEHRIVLADGSIRYIHEQANVIFDSKRRPKKIIGTAHDITERKLAEEQIKNLNAQLERRVQERTLQLESANKELEAFSYSVSHDLRAPLRAMNGFARALMEDFTEELPEEARRYVHTICNAAIRMGNLIDDLLSLSRLSRSPMTREEVRMNQLVQSCLDELAFMQKGRVVSMKLHDLPTCMGDISLLRQVWLNLLSNALKYTQKRSEAVIEVGSTSEAAGVNTYYIRDNGAGFNMMYAGKLFGVFQRLHRAEDYEGTGVGLAIVQRIIHRHGGRIWAEAEEERGAAFYFTIPEKL